MDKKHTISALVANRSGVLTRISGLFARRGYNIESLSVCTTEDEHLSRMTIVINGDNYILEQIVKQLDKLIDVKKISLTDENNSIYRELLLIKVSALPEIRTQIVEISNIYKAKIVDLSLNTITIENTGEPNKLDAFIKVLEPYGIMEMARTGVTALMRGDNCIKDLLDYNDII
jgi:acetolactate synthase-1/3 small subunit